MKTYLTVLEELGWPKVYLVTDRQFHKIEGDSLYRDKHMKRYPVGEIYYGVSATKAPIITLRHNLRGKVLKNTIIHEIIHIVQPWRTHWWIECAAELLAGGGGRGYYSTKYNHTVADLPPKEEVLRLIRLAVKRFNRKG